MQKEIEFERIWEAHFEYIKNYHKWLREHGHYRPDFIAKRGDRVFIVEVKSQSRGKISLFGEHQKKALVKAYDFGLTPTLLIVPLNFNIEIGEPQLKEIEKGGKVKHRCARALEMLMESVKRRKEVGTEKWLEEQRQKSRERH